MKRGHSAAGNRFVAATAGGDGGIKCRTIKLEQRVLFGLERGSTSGPGAAERIVPISTGEQIPAASSTTGQAPAS